MVVILIVIALFCFGALLLKAASRSSSAENTQKSVFTEEQTHWLQKVCSIFEENRALPFLEVYVECGMSREVAYSKDDDKIFFAFPFHKNEARHNGYDVFMAYHFAISKRYRLSSKPLRPIDEKVYGLNLSEGEVILRRINSVVLREEKIGLDSGEYSGLRWEGETFRGGGLSCIGNEIVKFIGLDAGCLIITDHRIFFSGDQRGITKSVLIKDVLHYNLYQDGVLVNVPNCSPILLQFRTGYNAETLSVEDGLNEFVLVLGRVVAGTQNDDVQPKARASS